MESIRFDDLTKTVAEATSRRRALQGLAAGAAALLGRLVAAPAAAQLNAAACVRPGKYCRGRNQCCGRAKCRRNRCRCPRRTRPCRHECIRRHQCCSSRDCHASQRCLKHRCGCTPHQRRCGAQCVSRTGCCTDEHCAAGQVCNAQHRCVDKPCGQGGPCLVFVTGQMYSGNLGGLEGADDKCQRHADDVGLPGTYRAWLSDANGSPAEYRFVRSTGPYVRTDGVRIADDWDDLTDGELQAPINVTETRIPVESVYVVWTNTDQSGRRFSYLPDTTCANWTGAGDFLSSYYGFSTSNDASWTTVGNDPFGCDVNFGLRLYCFQQS